MSLLGERLLAVHHALDAAGIPHAFGGAITLAYCTLEPRGTRDIDVNVFVDAARATVVLDAMPQEIQITDADRIAVERDGQVRLWWDDTPVDVFFETHEFHREVASGVVSVPFEEDRIPVLSCDALVVFKAMFNRTRDWADIEAMLVAGATEVQGCVRTLSDLLGPADPAVVRLRALAG